MLGLYYTLKPFLPRAVQIRLRRIRARHIAAGLGGRVVGTGLDAEPGFPWPAGKRAAVLVTHDVEFADGQARIPELRRLEESRGLRSCWNFVVDRYPVDGDLIADLRRDGHEIGVHGVKHDGKLFRSRTIFERRLGVMRDAAARWGAVGFRSPALLYDRNLLGELPFAWDSSLPAWDPFQPMPGGCNRYRPFALNNHCIELPVTLWQDFTLFEELQVDALAVWERQLAAIVARGGLVNVIIHPDYLTTPVRVASFAGLLDRVAGDAGLWVTTPSAVADWSRDILGGKTPGRDP